MNILSSSTHPYVIPNMYENIKEDILKNAGNQKVIGPHSFP